jgi:hypothetical protein
MSRRRRISIALLGSLGLAAIVAAIALGSLPFVIAGVVLLALVRFVARAPLFPADEHSWRENAVIVAVVAGAFVVTGLIGWDPFSGRADGILQTIFTVLLLISIADRLYELVRRNGADA